MTLNRNFHLLLLLAAICLPAVSLNARTPNPPPAAPATGGLHEVIDPRYKARYQEWKREFLSTDIGRAQWEMYAQHPHLLLTITVSGGNPNGAGSGKYKWNDKGELIEATISLGRELDEGYPSSVYYPVMNALEPFEQKQLISGTVLAATKIAHEFGHVKRTGQVDSTVYQLQTQLIPQYNKIFLSNGRDAKDPRLVEIESKIGGTPVRIWEDREYWGEANALVYLRDRFTDDRMRCALFSRIRHSVDLYAKRYEPRFLEVVRAIPNRKTCGWP